MQIPLFPLHTVLCPGIVIPLHVFEQRYREMTRHCLDTGDPFGVVLIRAGREVGESGAKSLAGVGAFAEIREAGRYPDGRYDLLAAATGRFAIENVDATSAPYLVAQVQPLDDEVGDEARAERLSAIAIRRFVRYLDLVRARDGEEVEALDIRVEIEAPDDDTMAVGPAEDVSPESAGSERPLTRRDLTIPDDPTVLSHLLSGIVQAELPRRQDLLEAATTVERLERLITLLDREIALLTGRLRWFAPDPRELGGARSNCPGPGRRRPGLVSCRVRVRPSRAPELPEPPKHTGAPGAPEPPGALPVLRSPRNPRSTQKGVAPFPVSIPGADPASGPGATIRFPPHGPTSERKVEIEVDERPRDTSSIVWLTERAIRRLEWIPSRDRQAVRPFVRP